MWNGLFVKSEREAEEKSNRHVDLEDEKLRKGVRMKNEEEKKGKHDQRDPP